MNDRVYFIVADELNVREARSLQDLLDKFNIKNRIGKRRKREGS